MQISIIDPVRATYIFSAIFVIALLVSIRKRKDKQLLSISVTQELKGLAILSVIFFHVGYCLVTDSRFLFPLSILAGVGVNLFLFLSGYGLTLSSINKGYSAVQFYKHRLSKLFIPLWIALAAFFSLDFFFLKIHHSFGYVIQSFLGIFPSADLWRDVNSPLWYFTLILFFYLLFPLVFSKKRPWLSAIILYAAIYLFVSWDPSYLSWSISFYQIHAMAFPLGILAANAYYKKDFFINVLNKINSFFYGLAPSCARTICGKLKLKKVVYYAAIIILLGIFAYTAYYSGVGKGPWIEQPISLITAVAIVIVSLMKKFEIRSLYYFGFYSYEIYLLHWPIISRYDFLFRFKFIPVWLTMVLYLIFFLFLGWLLRKATDAVAKLKTAKEKNTALKMSNS